MTDDAHWWSEDRVKLRSWLAEQNPQLADIYAGAIEVLFVNRVPGYVHFVCHAVREIGNRLPDVVLGMQDGSRLDYKVHMDTIASMWHNAATDEGIKVTVESRRTLSEPTATIGMPRVLAEKIDNLVRAHTQVAVNNTDRAQRLFEFFVSPRNLGADVIRAKATQWRDTIDYFEKYVHVRLMTDRQAHDDELITYFCNFESAIASMFAGFYETMDKIDDILAETNRRSS